MVDTDPLVKLRDALNAGTDHLNRVLQQIEDNLNACGLGVSVRVPFPDIGHEAQLGYGKHNGKWGLLYFSEGEATPLLKSSRQARVQAINHMPALMCGLREELESQTAKVQDAIATVQKFLLELE